MSHDKDKVEVEVFTLEELSQIMKQLVKTVELVNKYLGIVEEYLDERKRMENCHHTNVDDKDAFNFFPGENKNEN